MAFPTGYSKYQTITIDKTKVPSDLTDYIVYVNLADLVKAGADIFDLCRSDGGDIRATKSDGTTELAVEIVGINTTTKVGEMYIKYTGTLSSTTDTVIRIYYNGTDTAPAVTDTYGRNAVWTAYRAVYHLDGLTDSTGNGYTLTNNNTVTLNATGKLGGAADFTSGNTNKTLSNATELGISNTAYTIDMWVNKYSVTTYGQGHWIINAPTAGRRYYGYYENSGGASFRFAHEGTANTQFNTSVSWSNNTWLKNTQTFDGTTLRGYNNGSSGGSSTPTGASTVANATFRIGSHQADVAPSLYWQGLVDEVRVSNSQNSANWITTEYNNQNSSSTFYAVSDELGGSTGVTVTPAAQVATFSTPAESVKVGIRKFPVAQTATFSVPSRVVSLPKRVLPATQVATFTIPAYAIIADGNIVLQPATQIATFSIPTYSVKASLSVSPLAQVATFSVPTPIISIISNITVFPLVQVLTFTVQTIAKVGGVWTKRARSTDATWSKRSVNDN